MMFVHFSREGKQRVSASYLLLHKSKISFTPLACCSSSRQAPMQRIQLSSLEIERYECMREANGKKCFIKDYKAPNPLYESIKADKDRCDVGRCATMHKRVDIILIPPDGSLCASRKILFLNREENVEKLKVRFICDNSCKSNGCGGNNMSGCKNFSGRLRLSNELGDEFECCNLDAIRGNILSNSIR